MRKRAHWTLALGASLALHSGAAAIVLSGKEETEKIAGGEVGQTVVLGSAFADMVAAGEPSETVEAVSQETDPIAPAGPDAAVTAPVEQAMTDPAEPTMTASAEPTSPALPAERAPEAESAEAATVEALEPAVAHVPEPQRAETRQETVAPAEPRGESVVATVPVPRPTPRPDYHPPKEKRAVRKAAPEPVAKPPTQQRGDEPRKSAGSSGRDARDAQRGASEGSRTAEADGGRKAARASQAGNAAVSNYPGKIVARLRRALRYPREAERERLRGEVRVGFTIISNGAVGNVRVVRSSGSPVLDRAAVETVRRAAPFPAIPAGAGRSSWPFTVPLAFVR